MISGTKNIGFFLDLIRSQFREQDRKGITEETDLSTLKEWSSLQIMIIVNEIIAAKLPEEHGGPNIIKHFIENQIFLQGAISSGSVGKHFQSQLLAEQRMIRLVIGDRRGMGKGVSNDKDLRPSRPDIASIPARSG